MQAINKKEYIGYFTKLGEKLKDLATEGTHPLFEKASIYNPWFTIPFTQQSLLGLSSMLNKEKLEVWLNGYDIKSNNKSIGIIAAGNIPLVAFHDIVCVLITGNRAIIKLSSKDQWLYQLLIDELGLITHVFDQKISLTTETLKDFDAIIATGSNNSARYFEYYFGKYPNIIRQNRNSIAILNGSETEDDLRNLAQDIFFYFGLGCRNISQIFIPKEFDITKLIDAFSDFEYFNNHNKYFNNYEYQKSVHLLNLIPFFDNGFSIIKESPELTSPIGVINFTRYEDIEEVNSFYMLNKHKIQCAVSKTKLSFSTYSLGMAQKPELWDYADNIDTIKFILNI